MTAKKQKQLDVAYQNFIQALVYSMHIGKLDEFIVDDIMGYGTAIDEKIFSISDFQKVIERTKVQSAGMEMSFELTPVFRKISPDEDSAIIVEELQIIMLVEETRQELSVRITSVLEYINRKWMAVHCHASIAPELSVDDAWHVHEWQLKNEELQKQVAEKTASLHLKNRELEIEAALERVRAVAMGMNKPDDMLDVCRMISGQLELLNVKDIRNVQTAIFYENKGTYLNYEYYARHDKLLITEVDFENHKVQKKFAHQMLKGAEELFTISIRGKEIHDWYNYQKTTNQFADVYLQDADSLNYYWYSLGPVALGMSTYAPMYEEDINIFKRFRNVFELSYRRFLDIEKAIAQAREAQIEASLERVRAQASGMHKPGELPDICEVLWEELKTLGFDEIRNAMINIHDDEKGSFINYHYSAELGKSINQLSYNIHPVIEKQIRQMRSAGDAFSETCFKGKDLKDWKAFRKKVGEKDDPRIDETDALYYYLYSIGTGSIGISTFKAIAGNKLLVLKRFRNVFEFAYRRYIEVAQAELQAKEAQIEAALERVRSRSMGMQKSEELKEVIQVVYEQFVHLNIKIEHTGFVMDYKARDDYDIWIADPLGVPSQVIIPYFDSVYYNRFNEAKEKGEDFFTTNLSFEEKNIFYQKLFEYVPGLPEKAKEFYFSCPGLAASTVLLENICLYIENFSGLPFTDEENNILMRFGKVFQQTYTRFLDLQKAEAQAREAKIEAALEKVRSRAMAMHKTDQLLDAAELIYKELSALGITSMNVSYAFVDEDEKYASYYSVNPVDGKTLPFPFIFPHTENEVMRSILASWKKQDPFNVIELDEEATIKHQTYIGEHIQNQITEKNIAIPFSVEAFLAVSPKKAVIYSFNFKHGYLFNIGGARLSTKQEEMLLRFTKVFEMTYRRFLDLKQAETQSREAQIELALERVRARTMAMQRSEELQDTALLLVQQVKALGLPTFACGFNIWDDNRKAATAWMAGEDRLQPPFKTSSTEDVFLHIHEAAQRGEQFFLTEQGGEELETHYRYMASIPEFKAVMDKMVEAGLSVPTFQIIHCAFFSQGYLMFISYEPVPDAHDIFKRFAKVFEQTYTRFLDLQKAEAQAREAKIEAALERTRTQSMLMQHSRELDNTLRVFHEQVLLLGIDSAFSFLWLPDEEKDRHIFWAAWAENVSTDWLAKKDSTVFKSKAINYPLDRNEPATAQCLIDWKGNEAIVSYHVPPAGVENYFAAWQELIVGVEQLKPEYFLQGLYYVEAFMKYGCFGVMVKSELTGEEKKILVRFAIEFERAYTRFLDLQKAEAQARESQIEAALERVRSKAMAMQKSDDLANAVAIIFEELNKLNLSMLRCGIGILNKEKRSADVWTTTKSDNNTVVQVSGDESMDIHPLLKETFEAWLNQEEDHSYVLKGEDLNNYYKALIDENFRLPDSQSLTAGTEELVQYYYNASFSSGGLFAFRETEFPEEAKIVLRRFADVFNLTYTRFNDLKQAEQLALQAQADLEKLKVEKTRTEEALTELKSTQAQLIQAEKMASLGELTAGIAHEIQNPLNFVNNFSEVNSELIEELRNEKLKPESERDGKFEENLLKDIESNLEKISHHGRRADAIVKGMLQHSRSSSSIKDPTDLNKLADEYLRLAYHGLRAKDKSFNARLTTDYDASVGHINIIAQDLGRVILNLITNAFYAIAEKKAHHPEHYEPTVTVATKRNEHNITLTVKDNGNGIPAKVFDKIFQPFFTTKPTGQGTGLGLSLSYDIVKAHGGELKVNTRVGEGSEFIIQLPIN